ncbi:hypothetical protein PR048_025486 [Dryococelus australis]|uniref:Uncharacterized protein n=1 Tax=Dryococelus australis TaxID=614101 RepID=A0ABQ9GRI5_9NEOP|nr:hypothetical protein PR048_025486 [Dryococelus australis]
MDRQDTASRLIWPRVEGSGTHDGYEKIVMNYILGVKWVGDQKSNWVSHACCSTCVKHLTGWAKST